MLIRTLFLMPLLAVLAVAFTQYTGAAGDSANRSPYAGRHVTRSAQPPAATGSSTEQTEPGALCPDGDDSNAGRACCHGPEAADADQPPRSTAGSPGWRVRRPCAIPAPAR